MTRKADPFAVELTPELILRAYQAGIFPMAEDASSDDLFWVSPQLRGVIPLDQTHISRSLRKTLKTHPYSVKVDTDFRGVIEGCATAGTERDTTWINPAIRRLYGALFDLVPGSGAWEAQPYTIYQYTKVALLASGGLLVFVVSKPLLETFHGGIDVDRAHDPVAFYGAKALSGGLGGGYNRVNDAVVGTGWALVRTAHDPSRTIRGVVPAGLRDRYDRRLERTPGKTGGKLGIGLTIYVATGVLMLALGFALFIH